MKKYILLLFLGIFFITNVNACTTTDPCLELKLSANNNIGCATGGSAACKTIGLIATTSFDPASTETIPCTDCYLEIQDCNGSLLDCGDSGQPADWNGIPSSATFENDFTCANDCRRTGAVEDTAFNARITSIQQGSHYFRSCWYNSGALVKCSDYQRLHWYTDTVALFGTTDCRPDLGGNTIIQNRDGITGTKCIMQNHLDQDTQVLLVYWLDGDLILQNSTLELYGISIDFNRSVTTSPKIVMDENSQIIIKRWSSDRPPWTDVNIAIPDRNIIYSWGYNTT